MVVPKSSIFRGFSIINHPFWDTPIFGNTHICMYYGTFFHPDCTTHTGQSFSIEDQTNLSCWSIIPALNASFRVLVFFVFIHPRWLFGGSSINSMMIQNSSYSLYCDPTYCQHSYLDICITNEQMPRHPCCSNPMYKNPHNPSWRILYHHVILPNNHNFTRYAMIPCIFSCHPVSLPTCRRHRPFARLKQISLAGEHPTNHNTYWEEK